MIHAAAVQVPANYCPFSSIALHLVKRCGWIVPQKIFNSPICANKQSTGKAVKANKRQRTLANSLKLNGRPAKGVACKLYFCVLKVPKQKWLHFARSVNINSRSLLAGSSANQMSVPRRTKTRENLRTPVATGGATRTRFVPAKWKNPWDTSRLYYF